MTIGRVGQEFTAFDTGYHLSIAGLSGGRFVIVTDGGGIHARMFDAAGVAIGGDFSVNTNLDGGQFAPSVAERPGGGFIVVWESSHYDSHIGGNATDFHARFFRADGEAEGNDFTFLFGATAGAPEVAALRDGHSFAVWGNVSNWPDGFATARSINADGSVGSSVISLDPIGGQHPKVAALADGHWVAAWWGPSRVPPDWYQPQGPYFRIFDADGHPLGNSIITGYSQSPEYDYDSPSVAALPQGGFVLTWAQGGFGAGLHARIFDQRGAAVGGDILVDLPNSYNPVVAGLADGRFVVAWQANGVTARVFAADGSPAGDEFTVNDDPAFHPEHLQTVEALTNGSFAVAWSAYDASAPPGTVANTFIRTAIFDPTKLNGTAQADTLKGGNFDDVINGGGGADTMVGGMGNDQYFVDNAGDVVTERLGEGTLDRVLASISYALPAGLEIEKLTTADSAGTGPINLTGNEFTNAIFGNNGDNSLDGKAGNDSLSGLGGNDRIEGGDGIDKAFYSGARSEYDVRAFLANGVLQTMVAHRGGTQGDGVDTLTGVETLGFSDQHAVALAGAQLNHLASLDGDRFDDVLFQNSATGQVYFVKMIDGAFHSWSAATAALGGDWKAIASGDVNPGATGGAETFAQQQSTGSIYYASLDTGTITWGVVTTGLTSDWKLRAVADLNGDAAVDAIVQNQTTGAIVYAAMANGAFQGWHAATGNLGSDWLAVAAGDINRDGFADVVAQQQSTGAIYYAGMAGGVFSGWGVVSQSLTPDWKVKAVADVTADGFADVIVQQASTGITYFADMQNGGFHHWGVVAANVTPDWVVQGTADVDNDGFADVLFQNLAGSGVNPGTTYYANMGPAGFEGWGDVASNITAEWHTV